jgi:hypothetical protein
MQSSPMLRLNLPLVIHGRKSQRIDKVVQHCRSLFQTTCHKNNAFDSNSERINKTSLSEKNNNHVFPNIYLMYSRNNQIADPDTFGREIVPPPHTNTRYFFFFFLAFGSLCFCRLLRLLLACTSTSTSTTTSFFGL